MTSESGFLLNVQGNEGSESLANIKYLFNSLPGVIQRKHLINSNFARGDQAKYSLIFHSLIDLGHGEVIFISYLPQPPYLCISFGYIQAKI